MDGLSLLRQAEEAGLAVALDGGRLVIRGPKRAEPVARLLIEHKPDVLAVLVRADRMPNPAKIKRQNAAEAQAWHDRYAARIVHWFRGGDPWQEAERLAFGELILAWHRERGVRSDPARCAGCSGDLRNGADLILDYDGTRVHLDGVRGVDCIIAYGTRWRGAAVAGLRALGIDPPKGLELP
jgi:hypothetical protein